MEDPRPWPTHLLFRVRTHLRARQRSGWSKADAPICAPWQVGALRSDGPTRRSCSHTERPEESPYGYHYAARVLARVTRPYRVEFTKRKDASEVLEIDVAASGGLRVLRLTGELDMAGGQHLSLRDLCAYPRGHQARRQNPGTERVACEVSAMPTGLPSSTPPLTASRREFLLASAASAAALLVGFRISTARAQAASFEPNAFDPHRRERWHDADHAASGDGPGRLHIRLDDSRRGARRELGPGEVRARAAERWRSTETRSSVCK